MCASMIVFPLLNVGAVPMFTPRAGYPAGMGRGQRGSGVFSDNGVGRVYSAAGEEFVIGFDIGGRESEFLSDAPAFYDAPRERKRVSEKAVGLKDLAVFDERSYP